MRVSKAFQGISRHFREISRGFKGLKVFEAFHGASRHFMSFQGGFRKLSGEFHGESVGVLEAFQALKA